MTWPGMPLVSSRLFGRALAYAGIDVWLRGQGTMSNQDHGSDRKGRSQKAAMLIISSTVKITVKMI